MTPPARRISKEDWERHEATIDHLYHVRGLQLSSKRGEPSVQQVMLDEHGFSATVSQYELYLKKRDRPKNLKKQEWRAVHTKIDELSSLGLEVRVKVAGQIVTKDRLDRSRRHAFAQIGQRVGDTLQSNIIPPRHRVLIETRTGEGEWSEYVEGSIIGDTPAHPPTYNTDSEDWGSKSVSDGATPEGRDSGASASDSTVEPISTEQDAVLEAGDLPETQIVPSSLLWPPKNSEFGYSSFCCDWEVGSPFGTSWTNPPGYIDLPMLWSTDATMPATEATEFNSLGRTAITEQQAFSPGREKANLRQEVFKTGISPVNPQFLTRTLIVHHENVLSINPGSRAALPDPDDVLDRLFSLLPTRAEQGQDGQALGLVTKDFIAGSPLCNALFFSFVNNFAGLQGVPKGAILKMLRAESRVSARLFEYVQSSSAVQAKALADNIFRAAVEAGDEEAVIMILQGTKDSANSIDPNAVVCELDGDYEKYTPLQLAITSQNLGMVKTLLAAKADVNKTHVPGGTHDPSRRSPLYYVFKGRTVNIEIVQVLLDCGARIDITTLEIAIERNLEDVVRKLFPRLEPASHCDYFHRCGLLKSIVTTLEDSLAAQVIERLGNDCHGQSCTCLELCQRELNETVYAAAKRGMNTVLDLVLPHTVQKSTALCGAIRNGNLHLIDLLLQGGADIGYIWHEARSTPLAEAIWSQDPNVLRRVEDLGAFSCLHDKYGFNFTVMAAMEHSDGAYVQKLLDQSSAQPILVKLKDSLVEAVHAGKTEVILSILDALCLTDVYDLPKVLLAALRNRNKDVAEAILEFNLDLSYWENDDSREMMVAAAEWGDKSITSTCLSMAGSVEILKAAQLEAAVQSRNTGLVDLLLNELKGSRNFSFESSVEAATRNRDDAMARLLFSKGADPANAPAFSWAIENDGKFFCTLLEMFSLRYPEGKKGFGSSILFHAICDEDVQLLRALLRARLDASSFYEYKRNLFDDAQTALGTAIKQAKERNLELIEILLDSGIDPNSNVHRNSFDGCGVQFETALLVAIKTRNEQTVELLLKSGADLHIPARLGVMRTPLQQACEICSFKMIKLLLDNGASVNEPPARRGGATSLQLAAISGSVKIVQLLLDHGALIHAPVAKNGGRTAFEGAAEYGRITILKVLWAAAGGLGFTQRELESAERLAGKNGHGGCVEYIATLAPMATDPLPDLGSVFNLEGDGNSEGMDLLPFSWLRA